MITIVKDEKKLVVTKHAYKSYYKHSGWTIEGSQEAHIETKDDLMEESTSVDENVKNEDSDESEEEWDEEWDEEEEYSKPISEMNRKELEIYAEKNDIDITSARNNKELKEIISKASKL